MEKIKYIKTVDGHIHQVIQENWYGKNKYVLTNDKKEIKEEQIDNASYDIFDLIDIWFVIYNNKVLYLNYVYDIEDLVSNLNDYETNLVYGGSWHINEDGLPILITICSFDRKVFTLVVNNKL